MKRKTHPPNRQKDVLMVPYMYNPRLPYSHVGRGMYWFSYCIGAYKQLHLFLKLGTYACLALGPEYTCLKVVVPNFLASGPDE